MNCPGQSSIEALHTVTLYIYIYREIDEPPRSINDRSLAYHYTFFLTGHIERSTGRHTPPSPKNIQ